MSAQPHDINQMKDFVFFLETDDGRALTGFKSKNHNGILTSLHGVAGARKINVYNRDRKPVVRNIPIVKLDIANDVALLSNKHFETLKYIGLNSGDVNKSSNKDAYVLGFPKGSNTIINTKLMLRKTKVKKLHSIVDGDIAHILRKRNSPSTETVMINIQGHLEPGHSGAPIFNSRNEVIGIGNGGLDGGMNERTWAVNINHLNLVDINRVSPTVISKLHHLDDNIKPLFRIKHKAIPKEYYTDVIIELLTQEKSKLIQSGVIKENVSFHKKGKLFKSGDIIRTKKHGNIISNPIYKILSSTEEYGLVIGKSASGLIILWGEQKYCLDNSCKQSVFLKSFKSSISSDYITKNIYK